MSYFWLSSHCLLTLPRAVLKEVIITAHPEIIAKDGAGVATAWSTIFGLEFEDSGDVLELVEVYEMWR
jgi:hypothetical protein